MLLRRFVAPVVALLAGYAGLTAPAAIAAPVTPAAVTQSAGPGSGAAQPPLTTASGRTPVVGPAAAARRTPRVTRISQRTASTRGGATITIHGTNLTGATAVLFGTTRAKKFTVKSGSRVVAIAPKHAAETVNVRVRTRYGTSARVKADRLTFVPPPGTISGTVKSASGQRLAKVTVEVASTGTGPGGHAKTSAQGTYSVTGLAPGKYSVCFYPPASSSGYVAQCYRNKPADGSAAPQTVTVKSAKTTKGVNASLTSAGSISGTVTNASDSSGVSGVQVDVSSATSPDVGTAVTGSKGTYSVTGLAPGSYTVCFTAPSTKGSNYIAQCYDGQPADGSGTPDPVTVTGGKTTTGIDAALEATGSISGTVSSASSSAGIGGVDVEVTPASAAAGQTYGTTAANGTYTVSGLPAGSYTVCFYPPTGNTAGYAAQCYDNEPADGSGTPDPVSVGTGSTTSGIDAQLAPTAGISGTVTTAADGSGVGNVDVEVFPSGGSGAQADAVTAADGTYTVSGLTAGSYSVCFYPPSAANGLISQCYDDEPVGGSSPPDPVTVTGGSVTSGIDAALASSGSIAGTVTAASGGAPVSGVDVEVTSADTGATSYATTAADGTYTVPELAADTYTVCFYPPAANSSGYQAQCYNDEPADGSVSPDPVTVTAGSTTSGISAALTSSGAIAGVVTDASTSAPLSGVEVDVYPAGAAGSQGTTVTAADGTYSVGGLADGTYTVCFYGSSDYTSQCYNDEPSDGSGTPDTVTVSGGATTSGIDAAMVLASASATAHRAAGASHGNAATSATSTAMDTDPGCYTHQLARDDDGSTSVVTLPFTVNFYGTPYNSLYVNNNGNLTFGAPMSTYTPFDITAVTPPIIAPFFADVDTRATSSGITSYGVVTYQGRPAFCVSWRRVGYYSEHTDKTNSFQVLLVNDDQYGDFDIVMNYNSIQWETGDASGGTDGLGGTSAAVGFSNGDGNANHFYELPGSLVNGAFLDSNSASALATHSNVTPAVPGHYVYHIASGNQVTQTNLCSSYYFVSVRGSGETSTGVDDQSASAVTDAVYKGMLSSYTGATSNITFYQVPYQALSVNVLTQGMSWNFSKDENRFFDTNLPTYLNSVSDGLNQLNGYLDSVSRTCAAQHKTPKFILVGYSQGALVIHQYLLGLPSASPIHGEIAFVGLVADPAAVANSKESINWGTALLDDYGICHEAQNILNADLCSTSSKDIPGAFKNITEAVCDSGDIVCDTSHTFSGWIGNWYGNAKQGMRIHTSYPSASPGELKDMGKEIPLVAHMN